MSLFAELKRRNVIRMAGLYLIGAWLIAQIAETLLPIFHTPEWVLQTIVVLLAIGFVPIVIFAWIFEMTPQGIKRDAEANADQSIAPRTAQRMNRTIIALLVIALGYFCIDKFVLAPARLLATAPVAHTVAVAPMVTPSNADEVSGVNPKSIAVLAFADMSASKDSEYLADGIAEEILNALAQVRDLKVAGRTSSFYYKGRNESLQTMGAELGVANVLEGSVRRQGERVRITAQLIQVEGGFHRWSETYDGDMADVFALQERIARSISEKLELVLNVDQRKRLVDAGTANAEAYALFLRANDIFNRRDSGEFRNAMALLEQAIEIDPGFARAESRLAALHAVSPEYLGADLDESLATALTHARRALELRQEFAEAHAVIGYVFALQRQYSAAREHFERAIAIDPNDPVGNFWFAVLLGNTGYIEAFTAQLDRVLAIDPMLPNALIHRARQFQLSGDLDASRRMADLGKRAGAINGNLFLALLIQAEGRTAEAQAAMERGINFFSAGLGADTGAIIAQGVYGDTVARDRAVARVRELASRPGKVIPGILPWALMMFGEPTEALSLITSKQTSSTVWYTVLWGPLGKSARTLPEFAEFARQVGFAEHWDKYGPPDLCKKTSNGDYQCE